MAIKKSELYSSLWKSCDELRGGMDASQYKDYVLILLFVKYVSDKYADDKNALIEIPKGGSFKDMISLKGKTNIGEGINIIIATLARANELTNVIDVADFDDSDKLGKGKDKVDRLSNLVAIFENENLDFSKNRADGDDILGDAYEYLMRHFATESGKSKGQFYTPAEVSRVIAKVINISDAKSASQSLYDPTCGSSSLLLKAADEAPVKISIYGQEMDNATAALAKMNMILHGHETNEIWQDNTLSKPHFKNDTGGLKTFDYVVSNPPFSYKSWSNGVDVAHDPYERFETYGTPPAKNGDYAFLLHVIRSLKAKGKGAIILPHGVLFRGNAEAEIRKNIIRKGYIKGIIGLPANLFYGTGIPACIIVLDKENAENRKGIFIIDASKGFVKDGNKNRLQEKDIHKMVDVFNRQMKVAKYSRMVSVSEIEDNEFNLNIPRYIDSQESEDIQDIEAHLLGDIPKADIDALENYWEVYPTMKSKLFSRSEREGYNKLKIEPKHIRISIFSHPEFISYATDINRVFTRWKNKNVPVLKEIKKGDKPKKLIHELSENLLYSFDGRKLIDTYDIYQRLMTYYDNTMQDDVYALVTDGWDTGREIDLLENKKDWEGRLIPKQLMIANYFKAEQDEIEKIETDRDNFARQMEELTEEHGGEEGFLEEVKTEKGKITKALLQKRIKELEKETFRLAAEPAVAYGNGSVEEDNELSVLKKFADLLEQETETNKKVKDAQAALEKKLIAKYKTLTKEDIKILLVDNKWMAHLNREVQNEMDNISQRLAQRINELVERYAAPLQILADQTKELEKKVNAHLSKIAFK